MWNISAWSVRKPVPTILIFIILTLIGLVSFSRLEIDDNPNVDFPFVFISITQPGASPTEMEMEITRKVEDSLVGITGLENIRSTVTDSSSTTVAEFKIGTPPDAALNDVRDAIARIRQSLPQDIRDPSITRPNFSGEPILTYTVESDSRTVADLSRLVDETIARSLLTVRGVSQVRRSGGVDREIRVELNPDRLRALGVTADQINNQIRGLNLNLPGGRSEIGGQEQTIRTLGMAVDVDRLRSLQIALPSGGTARLDTLGKIDDGVSEVRQLARFNGKRVVSFSIVRAQGASSVSASKGVRAEVSKLEKTLPSDLKFTMIRDRTSFTYASYIASIDALLIGSLLAVIVIYLFLRSWQATLIGALAIPLSILGTFAFMVKLGYTLNFMTLLAMILVVGILVDDAIVDLENIHRHIAMKKNPIKAAIDATDEIGLAVVATTMTIVAVFIPVGFMGGIPGPFFRSFGVTVAIAVLFSLLVARTLTPMMAAYLLPAEAEHVEDDGLLQRTYRPIIHWALDHRLATSGLAVAIFISSLMLVPLLPKNFFDQGDISEASISVELPSGAPLADTDRVAEHLRKILSEFPEVKGVFTTIGSSVQVGINNTGGAINKASVNVLLVPPSERKMNLKDFEAAVSPRLAEIPGARVGFNHFGPGGGSKPVNVILKGNDAGILEKTANTLIDQMRGMPELRDVTSSAAALRPELVITPDFLRAADQGVSVATIGRIARIATQGDTDVNMPKFNAGDRQIPIMVKIQDSTRYDLQGIGDLLLPGKNGLVPLRSVAEISLASGPVQIDRWNRARQITFSANLSPGAALGQTVEKVYALPIMSNLPSGITKESFGEAKVMADVFGEFALALGAAVVFIYAVLVLLFSNFMHPFTIMVALPLSIGGAMAGLLIANKPLGLMSLIGIVMLMGLVTKNSILLVEYAILIQETEKVSRREAITRAGVARLRPILMTTIAMIAGMLPIALSIGTGTETKSPMAVAVIGGLITSTIFTLLVIPAFYTYIDDLRLWLRQRSGLNKRRQEAGFGTGPLPPLESDRVKETADVS